MPINHNLSRRKHVSYWISCYDKGLVNFFIGKIFLHYSPYNIQMDNIIYSDGYNIIYKLWTIFFINLNILKKCEQYLYDRMGTYLEILFRISHCLELYLLLLLLSYK